MNRTVRIIAVGLVGAALIGSSIYPAMASDDTPTNHDDTMSQLQKRSEAWVLPQFLPPPSTFTAIDTDGLTRGLANQRMIDRLGYTANQVVRADRVHVLFEHGSHTIGELELKRIKQLAKSVKPEDQLVITGYAGQEIEPEQGLEIAKRRAEYVASLIKETSPTANIQVDATPFWPGSSDSARRAEVYRLGHLTSR